MHVEEWLNNEKIGIDIWNNKYRYEEENFDEWLDRVCNNNNDYKELIISKKFLPAGRILSNRGLHNVGKKITYSNCYVGSKISDNLESIFETAKNIARTFSYGGGIGIDISNLRPNKSRVNNAARTSSGAVSFMELYSMVTGLISQSGRRGALMISIDCSHPDLEEFIDIKKDLNKVTKANISIKISDNFMKAVEENNDFTLEFTVEATGDIITKTINARKLFRKIAENNWSVGEPAMLFWDNINSWNLLSEDEHFEYAGVNPCAEESLPAGGSCLLGSINLSEFIKNNSFDFKSFEKTVRLGIRFLNELLLEGLPLHPLQEQRDSVSAWRQIGLGIMGLADMFIKLSIKYGSQNSLDLIDKIGFLMIDTAIQESAFIAKEIGKYPNFSDKIFESKFFIQNTSEKTKNIVKQFGLANSQLLTCAPTGSLSTMLGISGGIEPIYSYIYTRKTESLHDKEKEYKIYTPIVKRYIEENNLNSESDLPEFFTNALLLDYNERILVQSKWQNYIDASISSTVNLPETATVEDVENIYLSAWNNKLKGITVFRNNCDRAGILNTGESKAITDIKVKDLPYGTTIQISNDLIGKKRKIMTGCGTLHIMGWFDQSDGNLMEVYLSKGSDGGCNSYMVGLSRMISAAMRTGLNFDIMIDQLKSVISCPSYTVRTATKRDTSKGKCCPDAIANALIEMRNEVIEELGLSDEDYVENINIKNNICPNCGIELKHENGCISCLCGWSKCE